MARADLMCELIKYGLLNDNLNFRWADCRGASNINRCIWRVQIRLSDRGIFIWIMVK